MKRDYENIPPLPPRKTPKQIENIEEMMKRHKKEIEKLQSNCKHEEVSQCMPFQWGPGHISHCVKTCKNCGLIVGTTFKKHQSPMEKLFECPKREDCNYYQIMHPVVNVVDIKISKEEE